MKHLPLAFLLCACGGAPPVFDGEEGASFFPFDGSRTWEFINADDAVTYKLVLVQQPDPTSSPVGNVYSIQHHIECVAADPGCVDGEVVRTVRWSSVGTDGAFLHGALVGGVDTVVKPPITVADENVLVEEDPWLTSTSDGDWSSDLVLKEACPVVITSDWESCLRFDVDDAGTSSLHDHVAGSYWANYGYNVVAFDLTDDGLGRWELSSVVCPDDDPCDGEW